MKYVGVVGVCLDKVKKMPEFVLKECGVACFSDRKCSRHLSNQQDAYIIDSASTVGTLAAIISSVVSAVQLLVLTWSCIRCALWRLQVATRSIAGSSIAV